MTHRGLLRSVSFHVAVVAAFALSMNAASTDDVARRAEDLLGQMRAGSDQAYRELRSIQDERVLPVLIAALSDPSERVRGHVCELLGGLRSSTAVRPLIATLADDPSTFVRSVAARALGRIGGPEAEQSLLQALDDPSRGVVGDAVRALGELQSVAAIEPLKALLVGDNEEDWMMQRHAELSSNVVYEAQAASST